MTKTVEESPASTLPSPTGAALATLIRRHVLVAVAGGVIMLGFWFSRPQWDPEMRLWKAVGDGSLVLLLVTVALGPLVKLWRPARRAIPWRREIGIWFAVLASLHTVLILNGWTRWTLSRFFGYEFVEQLGREARMEPGFGLANAMGLVALIWALVLAATSSDRAIRSLGPSAWKWLHNSTLVVFNLVLLHVGYFLFMHYTLSFHRAPPDPDWFRAPFAMLGIVVIGLQVAAFIATSRRAVARVAH